MSKVKISKIVLMILLFVFYLHLSGLTVADDCWDREDGGPTFTGDHNYPPDWFPEFQYDPNNPEEIDRSSSETISVIGGFPPYTWQVSGIGFSIPTSTTDRTNTLSADNTACSTATITVTDNHGVPITGYVRCTTGQWVIKSSICTLPGTGTLILHDCDDCHRSWHYELIVGNKKQTQATTQWCFYNSSQIANCIDPDHNPPEVVSWDYYTDYSECSNPEDCENCDYNQTVTVSARHYYEWECN